DEDAPRIGRGGTTMIDGDRYVVPDAKRAAFRRDGWVRLEKVLTEAEVSALEADYERFLRREIAVPGDAFCDMAGTYDRRMVAYWVVNAQHPRRYHPAWRGNAFERRAASIAAQLQGDGRELDYDRLLAKPPGRPDGVFHWHQDLAYW